MFGNTDLLAFVGGCRFERNWQILLVDAGRIRLKKALSKGPQLQKEVTNSLGSIIGVTDVG